MGEYVVQSVAARGHGGKPHAVAAGDHVAGAQVGDGHGGAADGTGVVDSDSHRRGDPDAVGVQHPEYHVVVAAGGSDRSELNVVTQRPELSWSTLVIRVEAP